MDARFRIRTRDGKDLLPGTVEEFAELVHSGRLRPDDLVFDALTGEWAPARSHPMVRLFGDPLATEIPGPPSAEEPIPEEPQVEASLPDHPPTAGDPDDDVELKLDLVEPETVSPEEEARAFLAEMEEERRSDSDSDLPDMLRDEPLLDAKAGTVVGLVAERAPGHREPADPEPAEPEFATQEPARPEPASREGAPRPRPAAPQVGVPLDVHGGRKIRPPSRRRRRGWGNVAILGGALLALALSVSWPTREAEEASPEGVAEAGEARGATRTVTATEEQTRAVASEAYLDAVAALGEEMAVGEVPGMWLEGQYLADPEAYPEVRRYWEDYLTFVDAARAAEVTLYRGAYLMAAADAGLSGPARSLRLAAAQEDFATLRDRRDILYGRVEGLADAALALDDLMVELKGRIRYEPIAGPRLSADPVIEAVGTDPEAQASLEAALDQVLAVLQGPGGVPTRDRNGVPGWLVAGLRKVEALR